MIDVQKIDQELKELKENGAMSWDTIEKLCWLYTVRDHLMMDEGGQMQIGFQRNQESEGIRPTQSGELENLERNMSRSEIANEFNRHMEDIRNRHPMDYENTVRRMRENYYGRRGNNR